nr:hypothetical protein CFP56_50442 [Quercus suber]
MDSCHEPGRGPVNSVRVSFSCLHSGIISIGPYLSRFRGDVSLNARAYLELVIWESIGLGSNAKAVVSRANRIRQHKCSYTPTFKFSKHPWKSCCVYVGLGLERVT